MTDAGSLYNYWYIGLPLAEAQELAAKGEAVAIGSQHDLLGLSGPGTLYVRQHEAKSLDDVSAIIATYRAMADSHGVQIYFRGQTRDYYNGNSLTVVPAAVRDRTWVLEYLGVGRSHVDDAFAPWLEVLQELGLGTGTSDLYWFSDPEQPDRTSVGEGDRLAASRITTNPVLMAIAMHYGFPTLCLDVSTDPNISLWFALHQSTRDAAGVITFAPASHSDSERTNGPSTMLPSLYIYLQRHTRDYPVVELTRVAGLRDMAARPFVQSAVALPFRSFGRVKSPMLDGGFGTIDSPTQRYPSAVIKLDFDNEGIYQIHRAMSSQNLFPTDERLYTSLVARGVPELARY